MIGEKNQRPVIRYQRYFNTWDNVINWLSDHFNDCPQPQQLIQQLILLNDLTQYMKIVDQLLIRFFPELNLNINLEKNSTFFLFISTS